MNIRIPRRVAPVITLMAILGADAALAANPPVTNLADLSNGLSVVNASAATTADAVTVTARVNRARMSQVVVPQRLRFAVVASDGTVRAAQERMIGPAQLPRRNSREAHLVVTLATALAPNDRVVVEWTKSPAKL